MIMKTKNDTGIATLLDNPFSGLEDLCTIAAWAALA